MELQTFNGRVWDSFHILSSNVLLTVYGIPEEIINKTGFFLVLDKQNIKTLISYVC